jgi:hypothetical protein
MFKGLQMPETVRWMLEFLLSTGITAAAVAAALIHTWSYKLAEAA